MFRRLSAWGTNPESEIEGGAAMNVLILGANGELGPSVVNALEDTHRLRLSDINDLDTQHEYLKVDSSDLEQVVAATKGMDVIINLSVLRPDRKLAFDVNARGCYNMMVAAVEHGIDRVINTGPFYVVAGPTYERFDHLIGPDVPHQPGTYLYALTKSLGQEICRVFTDSHDIHVMDLLFYMLLDAETHDVESGSPIANIGNDLTPYTISWRDAAGVIRCALDVELENLPSRSEVFFVFADLPHQKFSNEKAKRVLGWEPRDQFDQFWRKTSRARST
jgi:nucleoside-diphosphate-sugar epimerase